jgi:hypothetical protein
LSCAFSVFRRQTPHVTDDRVVYASFAPVLIAKEPLRVVAMVLVFVPEALHAGRDAARDDLRGYALARAANRAIQSTHANARATV